MVGVRAIIPPDAFTADTLGTERAGNGVLIRSDGLVLTIGYLVTEAETIWLSLIDGRNVPGTVLAYDQATGFGLIQALARLDLPALPIGDSSAVTVGERVVVGGAGGRSRSVAARVVAKQEFAGYWEYVVDEAIFTAPSHPNWGGTALIGSSGELIGIGSLQLQEGREQGPPGDINMIVPIDLLKPIFDDLLTLGRPNKPPRPWLGLYATEIENKLIVVGLAKDGPAQRADLRTGDVLLSVGGAEVTHARRPLPPDLGARPRRRRGPDVDLSRRQDLRRQGEVERPHQAPQGAADALSASQSRIVDRALIVANYHRSLHRWIARARLWTWRRFARCRTVAGFPPGISIVTTHASAASAAHDIDSAYAWLRLWHRARARHDRQRRHVVVRGRAAGGAGRLRRRARRRLAALHADHDRLRRRRHRDGPARRPLRHRARRC